MMNRELFDAITKYCREHFPRKDFIPGETPIPAAGKVFDEREMQIAVQAVLDGWWTEGRFALEFEESFSKLLNRKYCVLVNSGSSANLLALTALTPERLGDRRLKPGDEVITVAAGFPTTIAPIIQNRCVPVFIDIDSITYNARLDLIEAAYSPKTRALMLAHTLGNPFPVREVAEWCKERGIWLIEDTCDALGGTYDGQPLGSFGDISTCSFYPAHHITMGEGGALVTDDAGLNKIIRSFRDWGRDCWCRPGCDNTCGCRFKWKLGELPEGYDHKYIYSELGYNLKITDMQAAIGLAQLEKLSSFHAARRKNHALLKERLAPLADVLRLPEPTPKGDPSWFGFLMSVRENAPFTREELMNYLNERKIGTRLLFAGNILKQPCLVGTDVPYRVSGSLTQADDSMHNTFWIGCYPGLDQERLEYVSDVITDFCTKRSSVWFGRRVLVTGGTGFVGSALVRRLVEEGADVTVISSGKTSHDRLATVAGKYTIKQVDLTDSDAVSRAFEEIKPTHVYHCATYGAFPTQRDVNKVFNVNVTGTNNLLAACEQYCPDVIVTTGSWTEYGSREHGRRMEEQGECLPSSTYGIAKLASTLAARAWSLRTNIPLTVLRLFSVFGEDEPGHRLIPTLFASANSGERVSLGDPSLVRDFIHVEDAVDAYLAVAEHEQEPGRIINIASGSGASIRQVVDSVKRLSTSFPEPQWTEQSKRPWDVPEAVADITRAQKIFNWRPVRSLGVYFQTSLTE